MRSTLVAVSSLCLLVPSAAAAQTESPSSEAPSSSPAPTAPSSETNAEPPATPPPASAPTPPPESQPPATTTAPPPASTSHPASASGESAPPQHPHEDDGRSIDLIFIQAEGGYSYVDLTGLSSQGRVLPTLMETRGSGYGGGATIGFRSWIFAVAAHGYIARFGNAMSGSGDGSGFDLGQATVEAQIRIPLPVIEPYVRIDFGYAWLGSFQLNSMYSQSTSNIDGWTGGAGAGVDIWLGKFVTIGAGVDFTVTNLRRGGVNRADSSCPMSDPTCVELTQDGDAFGTLTHVHLQAGLHF